MSEIPTNPSICKEKSWDFTVVETKIIWLSTKAKLLCGIGGEGEPIRLHYIQKRKFVVIPSG